MALYGGGGEELNRVLMPPAPTLKIIIIIILPPLLPSLRSTQIQDVQHGTAVPPTTVIKANRV